jgi:hypothetical protein
MLTPKRLAAALRDCPPKTTASTTRLRRSSESAIPAASFPRPGSSIRTQAIRESPSRFRPFGYRSKRRFGYNAECCERPETFINLAADRNFDCVLGRPNQILTRSSGRTGVRAKAVIPSQGRRDLDEIRKAGLYDQIWQAFADTLGITGHGRAYDRIVALRAVTSIDVMIADFYPYDMSFLARTATRIINEVRRVNRVVHDVTSKPPGTIEWE